MIRTRRRNKINNSNFGIFIIVFIINYNIILHDLSINKTQREYLLIVICEDYHIFLPISKYHNALIHILKLRNVYCYLL